MTNEQILKLSKTCGFTIQDRWSDLNDDVYYECEECELFKFARELYDKGNSDGYEECSFDMGDENV